MPPEVEEDYLPFLWLDSKWAHLVHSEEISILNLSSLHPSCKPYLGKPGLGRIVKLVGYSPQLLDDSLGWSDYESDCSALFTPAWISSRRRCTVDTRRSGTSCGGYDPRYPRQTIWATLLGAVQPTRRRPTVHGTARRAPQGIKGDILKILRDLLGYVRSHDSCNLLLLTGYLINLTDL